MAKMISIIRYKFKADRDFESVQFEGMSCSLGELKRMILDKSSRTGTHHPKDDYDVTIKDATTDKEYRDYSELIARNTSVVVTRRIRGSFESLTTSSYQKPLVSSDDIVNQYLRPVIHSTQSINSNSPSTNDHQSDLSNQMTNTETSEDERIKDIVKTSRLPYLSHPRVNSPLICHNCHQTGHMKSQCPLLLQSSTHNGSSSRVIPNQSSYQMSHHHHHHRSEIKAKNPTGFPRDDLPRHIPGAFRDQSGASVVPIGLARMMNEENPNKVDGSSQHPRVFPSDNVHPPEDILCSICKHVYRDAVITPCCHNNFCDQCIRNALIESEDHECPHCHRQYVPIDQINPNLFLRKHVERWRESTHCSTSFPTQLSLPLLDEDIDSNTDFDEFDVAILPAIVQPIQTGPIVIRIQPSTRVTSPQPTVTTQSADLTFEDGKTSEQDRMTNNEKELNTENSPLNNTVNEENGLTINDILSSMNNSDTEKLSRQTPPSQVAPMSTILSSPPTTTTTTMCGASSLVPHHPPSMDPIHSHLHQRYIHSQPIPSTGLYPMAPNYYGSPMHVSYPGAPSMLPVTGPPGLMTPHFPGYVPYPGLAPPPPPHHHHHLPMGLTHIPPNPLNGYHLSPYDSLPHPPAPPPTSTTSSLIVHHPHLPPGAPLSKDEFYMKQRDLRRNQRSSSNHRSRSYSSSNSSTSSSDSRRHGHRHQMDKSRHSSHRRSETHHHHRPNDRKRCSDRDDSRTRHRSSRSLSRSKRSPSNSNRRRDPLPPKSEHHSSKQRKPSPQTTRERERERERRRSPRPPPTIQQSLQRTIVYSKEFSTRRRSRDDHRVNDDRQAPSSKSEHQSQSESMRVPSDHHHHHSTLSSTIQSASNRPNETDSKRKTSHRDRSESSHSKSKRHRRSKDRSMSKTKHQNSTSISEH